MCCRWHGALPEGDERTTDDPTSSHRPRATDYEPAGKAWHARTAGKVNACRPEHSLAERRSFGDAAFVACVSEARWSSAAYLTLDIDCLDPAVAPGTGTSEPAGLTRGQVMTLLESWTDLRVIGMDCVEVAPAYDHAEITSLAAAHFIWTYLYVRIRPARVGA